MALELKRITHPYECVKCHITGEIIAYGDYYYEDDDDGLIVDFKYYYDMKQQRKVENAYYEIERALDLKEYEQRMKDAERDFLTATLFDRNLKANNMDVSGGIMPLSRGGKR
jgi:hypothetical protein